MRTRAGEPLEKAILTTQAKRDGVYRLMREIQRAGRSQEGYLTLSRKALEEADWLGAPWEEVEPALRNSA